MEWLAIVSIEKSIPGGQNKQRSSMWSPAVSQYMLYKPESAKYLGFEKGLLTRGRFSTGLSKASYRKRKI